jgi:hypothetical protein
MSAWLFRSDLQMLPLDRRSFRPRSIAFFAPSKVGYSGARYIADYESESPLNSRVIVEDSSWADVLTAACGRSGSVLFYTSCVARMRGITRGRNGYTDSRTIAPFAFDRILVYSTFFKSLSKSTSEIGYDLSGREPSSKH